MRWRAWCYFHNSCRLHEGRLSKKFSPCVYKIIILDIVSFTLFFCCIRRAVPECIELLHLYHRQDTNCWGCVSLRKALEQMSLLQTVEVYVKGSRCVTWRYLNLDRTKPWETWSALKRGLANNFSYSFKPKLLYDSTRFILKTNSLLVIICIQFRSFQLNLSTSW